MQETTLHGHIVIDKTLLNNFHIFKTIHYSLVTLVCVYWPYQQRLELNRACFIPEGHIDRNFVDSYWIKCLLVRSVCGTHSFNKRQHFFQLTWLQDIGYTKVCISLFQTSIQHHYLQHKEICFILKVVSIYIVQLSWWQKWRGPIKFVHLFYIHCEGMNGRHIFKT